MRILGIDPSLRATGLVLLDAVASPKPRAFMRHTVRPPAAGSLQSRLRRLVLDVEALLDDWDGWDAAVIEDITDQRHVFKRQPATTLTRLGAAYGALIITLDSYSAPLVEVPAGLWLPKTRTGNYAHAVRHAQHVAFRRSEIDGLVNATDDEVMAAGLAWWWAQEQRRPPALRADLTVNHPKGPRRKRK